MALLHRFTDPLVDAEGRAFHAEAHGHEGETGLWERWIEFVGIGRRVTLSTGVEMHQPDLGALRYWAAGLEPRYLEGALTRALRADGCAAPLVSNHSCRRWGCRTAAGC